MGLIRVQTPLEMTSTPVSLPPVTCFWPFPSTSTCQLATTTSTTAKNKRVGQQEAEEEWVVLPPISQQVCIFIKNYNYIYMLIPSYRLHFNIEEGHSLSFSYLGCCPPFLVQNANRDFPLLWAAPTNPSWTSDVLAWLWLCETSGWAVTYGFGPGCGFCM